MRRRWRRKDNVGPSGGRGRPGGGSGAGARGSAWRGHTQPGMRLCLARARAAWLVAAAAPHAHSPHTARRAHCWPSAATAPSHPLELRERGGSLAPWSAAFTRRALATLAKPRAPTPSRAACLAARPRQAKPRAPARFLRLAARARSPCPPDGPTLPFRRHRRCTQPPAAC